MLMLKSLSFQSTYCFTKASEIRLWCR